MGAPVVHLYHKYLSFCPVGLLFTGYKIDPWFSFLCVSGEWRGQMMFFLLSHLFFPAVGGGFLVGHGCCMNGEQFFAILYSNPPSLPTSSPSLSSTSPLLPCCSSNWWLEVWRKQGGGLKAGQMICSLPVEAYVALPVLGRIWMWQSELCWECEPLLCQGWTREAHNSI